MKRAFATLVVLAGLTQGCAGVGGGIGTPAQAPDIQALGEQRGVLPSWTIDHRLNGLLAQLSKNAPAASGRWRVILTRSENPAIEPLSDGRLLVTVGAVKIAQDEAQIAGILAVGMVRSRLAATAPDEKEDLTEIVEAAINTISHRRRLIFRLNGFVGSETGDPARTALSLVAAAGYDPAAVIELYDLAPANALDLDRVPTEASLKRALPKVQREYPGSRARNRAVWQEIRTAAMDP